jgi:septal ring factor EnvC (AmiA/AmiB activator)
LILVLFSKLLYISTVSFLKFNCLCYLAAFNKRQRLGTSSPVEDLNRIVEEQAAVIESLKKDKTALESSLSTFKTEHDRTVKENGVLRKAVMIQQDRLVNAENQLKEAQAFRVGAEERQSKLEQVILSLRYHLQAQHTNVGNDFMGPRPPDVY